ncbi:hypothetical protein GCM10010363_74400 [Streptomyces omiyaensis]|uniref:hypothetical protein n=1 Tax=Streptomyces omiyaensis TaxID=68247 RepID=UPI00167491DA|nr:hypothetical protein [Streptomyces omiyaensis]GGY82849.1 hypothetical protein GCM10010363_74400 [Streptomyces omiyaensis]
MTATVLTAETLISRYVDDIAYVAQQPPATDLAAFISQLDTAAPRYEAAGINGHEDLETASSYLDEALRATGTDRDVFLRRAHDLLRPLVSDMTQEYRTDVGD